MKTNGRAWIVVFAIVAAGLWVDSDGAASMDEEKAVREASSRFYVALNEMFTGNLDRMVDVWSHADDVTYMGPTDGFEAGWDKVLAIWKKEAALNLGGKVEASVLGVVVGDGIAVMYTHEKGSNVDSSGETQLVSIRATNVFRKESGTWKMIGHHTDLLPFLVK